MFSPLLRHRIVQANVKGNLRFWVEPAEMPVALQDGETFIEEHGIVFHVRSTIAMRWQNSLRDLLEYEQYMCAPAAQRFTFTMQHAYMLGRYGLNPDVPTLPYGRFVLIYGETTTNGPQCRFLPPGQRPSGTIIREQPLVVPDNECGRLQLKVTHEAIRNLRGAKAFLSQCYAVGKNRQAKVEVQRAAEHSVTA